MTVENMVRQSSVFLNINYIFVFSKGLLLLQRNTGTPWAEACLSNGSLVDPE